MLSKTKLFAATRGEATGQGCFDDLAQRMMIVSGHPAKKWNQISGKKRLRVKDLKHFPQPIADIFLRQQAQHIARYPSVAKGYQDPFSYRNRALDGGGIRTLAVATIAIIIGVGLRQQIAERLPQRGSHRHLQSHHRLAANSLIWAFNSAPSLLWIMP